MKAKKKTPFSAIQRSLAWYRKNGWTCEKTEQTVRWPDPSRPGLFKMVKRDLFSCIDGISVKDGEVPIFWQTTTTVHQADRIQKIAGLPVIYAILKSQTWHQGPLRSFAVQHLRFHVHGWAKKGPRGKAKFWKLTITEITLDEDGLLQTKVLPGTDVVEEEETGQKVMGFEKEDF